MIDLKAVLPEQLLNVTVAQRLTQIPGDRLQDECRLEVPALEIALGPMLELLDKGVQDHGPPPELEAHMQPASSMSRKRQNFATGPPNTTVAFWFDGGSERLPLWLGVFVSKGTRP